MQLEYTVPAHLSVHLRMSGSIQRASFAMGQKYLLQTVVLKGLNIRAAIMMM